MPQYRQIQPIANNAVIRFQPFKCVIDNDKLYAMIKAKPIIAKYMYLSVTIAMRDVGMT